MSQQLENIKRSYGVTTQHALLRAIAREWTEETGERTTIRDAEVFLDRMLETEYQRIEGGAYHRSCPECGRIFDMLNEGDADEYTSGHDCEPPDTNREGQPEFNGSFG